MQFRKLTPKKSEAMILARLLQITKQRKNRVTKTISHNSHDLGQDLIGQYTNSKGNPEFR